MTTPRVDQSGSDVLLWIKAVPGASRSHIAGALSDRLKVRIAAAPEHGKANQAICELLAKHLRIKTSRVSIESGQTNPEKIVRLADISEDEIRQLWESV